MRRVASEEVRRGTTTRAVPALTLLNGQFIWQRNRSANQSQQERWPEVCATPCQEAEAYRAALRETRPNMALTVNSSPLTKYRGETVSGLLSVDTVVERPLALCQRYCQRSDLVKTAMQVGQANAKNSPKGLNVEETTFRRLQKDKSVVFQYFDL